NRDSVMSSILCNWHKRATVVNSTLPSVLIHDHSLPRFSDVFHKPSVITAATHFVLSKLKLFLNFS
ncbi:MAG: hypothetical protein ABJA70_21245, partial [Chryseolinea sp.]